MSCLEEKEWRESSSERRIEHGWLSSSWILKRQTSLAGQIVVNETKVGQYIQPYKPSKGRERDCDRFICPVLSKPQAKKSPTGKERRLEASLSGLTLLCCRCFEVLKVWNEIYSCFVNVHGASWGDAELASGFASQGPVWRRVSHASLASRFMRSAAYKPRDENPPGLHTFEGVRKRESRERERDQRMVAHRWRDGFFTSRCPLRREKSWWPRRYFESKYSFQIQKQSAERSQPF